MQVRAWPGTRGPAAGYDEMTQARDRNPFVHAVELNDQRRAVRYAELKAKGAAFMIECQDLWDLEDEDAGVYFVGCRSVRGVKKCIREMDPSSDKVLGIYDLSSPLEEQGPGLTLGKLLSRS